MDPMERNQKIESFERAFDQLVDALQQFPVDVQHFRPAEGGWSIHEIILHIADNEAISYARIRKCIAEPGQSLMAYEGEAWARELNYSQHSLEEAMELFRWLRLRTYHLLRSTPEEAWQRTIHHPERGELSLDDLLEISLQHIPEHIEQMWANYAAWMKQPEKNP